MHNNRGLKTLKKVYNRGRNMFERHFKSYEISLSWACAGRPRTPANDPPKLLPPPAAVAALPVSLNHTTPAARDTFSTSFCLLSLVSREAREVAFNRRQRSSNGDDKGRDRRPLLEASDALPPFAACSAAFRAAASRSCRWSAAPGRQKNRQQRSTRKARDTRHTKPKQPSTL